MLSFYSTGPACLETVNGARFPAHVKDMRKAVEEEYVWKVSHLVKGENITNLLHWENKAGRRFWRDRTCESVTWDEQECWEICKEEMNNIFADDDQQKEDDDDSQSQFDDGRDYFNSED